jgi:hypothetical protein
MMHLVCNALVEDGVSHTTAQTHVIGPVVIRMEAFAGPDSHRFRSGSQITTAQLGCCSRYSYGARCAAQSPPCPSSKAAQLNPAVAACPPAYRAPNCAEGVHPTAPRPRKRGRRASTWPPDDCIAQVGISMPVGAGAFLFPSGFLFFPVSAGFHARRSPTEEAGEEALFFCRPTTQNRAVVSLSRGHWVGYLDNLLLAAPRCPANNSHPRTATSSRSTSPRNWPTFSRSPAEPMPRLGLTTPTSSTPTSMLMHTGHELQEIQG